MRTPPTLDPDVVASPTYRVVPHKATLLPGLDRAALNSYADEREDATVVEKLRQARKARR